MARSRKVVKGTLVVTAATYSAGDAVGGLVTITGLDPNVLHTWRIRSIRLTDLAGNAVAYEFVPFENSDFNATATDAEFDPDDDDLLRMASEPIQIANAYSFADSSVIGSGDVMREIVTIDGSSYGQFVTRGAPAYGGVSDVSYKIVLDHE